MSIIMKYLNLLLTKRVTQFNLLLKFFKIILLVVHIGFNTPPNNDIIYLQMLILLVRTNVDSCGTVVPICKCGSNCCCSDHPISSPT